MVKKGKKVKQKQRQSQKQIVNINLGKPTKRGKRKTLIKTITRPINHQLPPPPLYNITYQQPSLIPPPVAPTPELRQPSLIPAPIEPPRTSLPVRAGLAVGSAVGSGIGSAIVSTGSVVLSSIFWPPDVERPAVERPAVERPAVVPFPVREEPPAFANIEPVFAEPPFPLVPYQPPLPPPPDDEFFDLPEDPFNLEQPPEDVFNVAPAAAPAVEEEPEYLPYDATQFEDLRRLTGEYNIAAEQPNLLLEPSINEPFGASVVEINEPVVGPKPQKKKLATKPSTDDKPDLTLAQIRAKLRREEESAAKKEAKRREQGKDVRGLFPVEAQPVIIGEAVLPDIFQSQKEESPFGLEVIQRATPDKQKGGLERVRPEQPEEPLQYGFSN